MQETKHRFLGQRGWVARQQKKWVKLKSALMNIFSSMGKILSSMRQGWQKYFHYLWGKSSELKELEAKDALLAKTVLDIHRKRTHSEIIFIPLFAIQPIHAIDRENAIAQTKKRAAILRENKATLLACQQLSTGILGQYLPSVSGIKVVKQAEHSYIAFEGNGRLAALQEVFSLDNDLLIEVEAYQFTNPTKIIRRMQRVRRLNKL